jgi:lipoprotein
MHKIELPLVALCFCTLLAGCSSNQPAPLNDDSTTEATTTTTSSDLQQQIDDLQSQVSELQSQLATTTTASPTAAYEIGGETFSADEWISFSELKASKQIGMALIIQPMGNVYISVTADEPGIQTYRISSGDYTAENYKTLQDTGKIYTVFDAKGNELRIVFSKNNDDSIVNLSDLRTVGILE